MPIYAQPPIPGRLAALVTLGLNQSKLALLLALAQAGGSASTAELIDATGLVRTSALRHLTQLSQHGYISPDNPVRKGTWPVWTLDHAKLIADLQDLIVQVTPHGQE